MRDSLNSFLKEKNIEVISESIDHRSSDFRTSITKVKAENPDAIVFIAFGPAAEGTIYTSSFDHNSDQAIAFKKLLHKEEYKEKADSIFFVSAYDAVKLIAEIVKKCGDDTSCIKEELYNTKDYKGVSGTFSFDENGDVEKDIFMKVVREGKFELLRE